MSTKKTFSQKSAGAKILKVFLTFDSATAKKMPQAFYES